MASPLNLRPKQSCGCEAFQSPRPRRFSHDVAQVSIPIQQARASAWTRRQLVAHFGTADVANECPIIERKQTSAVTFGPAKTDHFGEPVQLQLWVRIFCLQSRRKARCWGGPWAFYKLRDDGIVPLICPTCQNVFEGSRKAIMPATPCYFAWGCFRYFSRERAPRRPCGCLSR